MAGVSACEVKRAAESMQMIKDKYVRRPVDLPHTPHNCCERGAEFVKNAIIIVEEKNRVAKVNIELRLKSSR